MTPIVRWAGGKRWLAPLITQYYREYAAQLRDANPGLSEAWTPAFVEPFAGGMAAALAAQPRYAVINDANPDLINLYWRIQLGDLRRSPVWTKSPEAYDRVRARFNALRARDEGWSVEAAACFYVLNKAGYNGLYRVNRRGQFNVPLGRYAWTALPAVDFTPYHALFQDWLFTAGDFAETRAPAAALVYVDPPYAGTYDRYTDGGFSWADQERLAAWCAERPGPVLLSNADTPAVRALYARHGFEVSAVQGPRRISRNPAGRVPAPELLAFKPARTLYLPSVDANDYGASDAAGA
jgi:DNA adenine methylase